MPTLLSIEALEADRLYVERQLVEAGDDPWDTARLMWESRLVDINKQISALATARSSYANVALIFDGQPVVGSSDIRLGFTTKILNSYQNVISIALASGNTKELSQRGPLPSADLSRLFIRDLVHGSMGFILEEVASEQMTMVPTALKDTVENTTRLLEILSSESDEIFEETLASTQPRLISAVHRFAKVLHIARASTKIVGDDQRLTLTMEDVDRLSRRLNEVKVTESEDKVIGTLLGILPESREFELKPMDNDKPTIKGTISEVLVLKYTADSDFKEKFLLQQVQAQVKIIRTKRKARIVQEYFILEALEPVPPDSVLV